MANFEKIIKEKLNSVDVSYNPNHWEEMDQLLNAKATKLSGKAKGLIGAAAVVAGVTAGALLWNTNADSKQNTAELPQQIENSIVNQTESTTSSDVTESKSDIAANHSAVDNAITLDKSENVAQSEANTTQEVVVSTEENVMASDNSNNEAPKKSSSAASSWGKFSVSETDVCQFGSVTFSIDGLTEAVSYLWDFGDGNTSNLPSPTHVYENDGSFDVSLTLTSIATGNDSTQTKEGLITVKSAPEFDFDWELANMLDIKTEVTFMVSGIDANETVIINLGDGASSNEVDFNHSYAEAGDYNTSATATNTTNGCQLSINKTVKVVNDYNLLAPTGFNPSSLIPENKSFIPVGLKNLGDDHSYILEIFNPRKGMERVYNTTTYTPWNGKKDNVGDKLAPGIYNWQALITKPDGSQKKYIGSVTLLH